MATDQRNLPAYLADDATFRQWGSGIAAQLAAVGLVQASDTGQINWTTVARPSVGALAGYEIWRFNDALQATKPVYIRVEYRSFSSVDRPALWISVGTGTNGAGMLTGQLSSQLAIQPGASKSSGVTLPSYCSGSSSRLNLATNLDAANNAFAGLICVERTKTAAGADTGDGIVLMLTSNAGLLKFQVVPFSGSIPSSVTTNPAVSLTDAGISQVGANVALSPTLAALGKAFWAWWCAYKHSDIGELSPFRVNHLGGDHTFLPLGDGLNTTGLVQGTATGHSLAILWE